MSIVLVIHWLFVGIGGVLTIAVNFPTENDAHVEFAKCDDNVPYLLYLEKLILWIKVACGWLYWLVLQVAFCMRHIPSVRISGTGLLKLHGVSGIF